MLTEEERQAETEGACRYTARFIRFNSRAFTFNSLHHDPSFLIRKQSWWQMARKPAGI
jgi:hypothetical protein